MPDGKHADITGKVIGAFFKVYNCVYLCPNNRNASQRARVFGVPLVRIELTPPAPEAGALSAELQGHRRR